MLASYSPSLVGSPLPASPSPTLPRPARVPNSPGPDSLNLLRPLVTLKHALDSGAQPWQGEPRELPKTLMPRPPPGIPISLPGCGTAGLGFCFIPQVMLTSYKVENHGIKSRGVLQRKREPLIITKSQGLAPCLAHSGRSIIKVC